MNIRDQHTKKANKTTILVDYLEETLAKVVLIEKIAYLKKFAAELKLELDIDKTLQQLGLDEDTEISELNSQVLQNLCARLEKSIASQTDKKLKFKNKFNHVGKLLDNRDSDVTLFYRGSKIDPTVADLFHDKETQDSFEASYSLFNPSLTSPNIAQVKRMGDNFFKVMLQHDDWKNYWEKQTARIHKEFQNKQRAEEYIAELINKLAGTYLYALATAWATRAENLETLIDPMGSCYLYVKPLPSPDKISEFRYSYFWTGSELYYISVNGTCENIAIQDPKKFIKALNRLNNISNEKVNLNQDQVKNLITKSSNHTPETARDIIMAKANKLHALSRITNNFHQSVETLIKTQTKSLKVQIQSKFDSLIESLPKDKKSLANNEYIEHEINRIKKSIFDIRRDKQYLCVNKADQILLDQLFNFFEGVSNPNPKDPLSKMIAEMMGTIIIRLNIVDQATASRALALFDKVLPFLDSKAANIYKPFIHKLELMLAKFEEERVKRVMEEKWNNKIANLSATQLNNSLFKSPAKDTQTSEEFDEQTIAAFKPKRNAAPRLRAQSIFAFKPDQTALPEERLVLDVPHEGQDKKRAAMSNQG